MRRLSPRLLPRVNAQTYVNEQNHDLKAEGSLFPAFQFPALSARFPITISAFMRSRM